MWTSTSCVLSLSVIVLLPVFTQSHPFPIISPDSATISFSRDFSSDRTKASFDVGALFNSTSPLGQLLGPLGGALSAFLGQTGNPTMQNELKIAGVVSGGNGTGVNCPAMSVIFARGTDEPGNVGILTGPPLFAALGAYMNNTLAPSSLFIQGVSYSASISAFLAGGSNTGASTMASMINSTLISCPNTQLLVSGYSQGAQLVHLATAALPASVTGKISSVVLFGDPMNGTSIQGVDASRILTICHKGDDICKGGDKVGLAHLSYSKDAPAAAMFALGGVAMLGITSANMKSVVDGISG